MQHKATRAMAMQATLHCLTGCAIGEVVGMVAGTAFSLSNAVTTVLSIILAFLFGYSLTIWSMVKAGVVLATALGIAFASDTLSIATMELVDNAVIWFIPGAVHAMLSDWLFWVSLGVSLVIAYIAAVPVNYALLRRGRGHALVHDVAHKNHH
jgi:hypothetical protein